MMTTVATMTTMTRPWVMMSSVEVNFADLVHDPVQPVAVDLLQFLRDLVEAVMDGVVNLGLVGQLLHQAVKPVMDNLAQLRVVC